MKIEIYKESAPAERSPIRLRLIEEDGFIRLAAVDADGDMLAAGRILSIDPDNGRILRNASVNREIGLPRDCRGRVILEDEE